MVVREELTGVLWSELPDFKGYFISENGMVYSVKRKKCLTPRVNNKGYITYCLSKDSKHYYRLAHRLVASAFLPNPANLPEVNHKDENSTNNHFSNLEWCSRKYNVNYGTSIERGKRTQGFQIAQYRTNGELVRVWPSIKEAARNGYDFRHIQRCLKGKNKTHGGYEWRICNAN